MGEGQNSKTPNMAFQGLDFSTAQIQVSELVDAIDDIIARKQIRKCFAKHAQNSTLDSLQKRTRLGG